jgi:hypothetical protein
MVEGSPEAKVPCPIEKEALLRAGRERAVVAKMAL